MSAWITIARLGEVEPGSGRLFEVGERRVALFNLEGSYYAIDGDCPHQGGPLADGLLDEDGVVTCPWHAWRFQIRDGVSPSSADLRVRSYPVRVEDGAVQLSIDGAG